MTCIPTAYVRDLPCFVPVSPLHKVVYFDMVLVTDEEEKGDRTSSVIWKVRDEVTQRVGCFVCQTDILNSSLVLISAW